MLTSYQLYLDAKGLKCPMPILKAKKALKNLNLGEILKVETTDPASEADFKAFVKQTGHKLLNIEKDEDIFCFFIQKNN